MSRRTGLRETTDAGLAVGSDGADPKWLGGAVRAELPGDERVEGRAVRLDDEGHLVIERADGAEITVTAADVVHVRPR